MSGWGSTPAGCRSRDGLGALHVLQRLHLAPGRIVLIPHGGAARWQAAGDKNQLPKGLVADTAGTLVAHQKTSWFFTRWVVTRRDPP